MGLSLRPVSPAALAAGNTNDYAAIGNSSFARLTPDGGGTSVITGIVAPSTPNDGQVIVILNLTATGLTIAHQSASSLAANRIILSGAGNITLVSQSLGLIYDSTTARWRQFIPVA